MSKIAVLISGGVDSSVALRLLKEEGHDVTAFYLKIWLEDELDYLGECPWEEDLEFVQAVCEQADTELQIVPLQQEYHKTIIKYAIDEVRAGRTPNPDIMCNNHIKFGAFYQNISDEYERVASGHYARLVENPGGVELHMTPDPIKDQTYFLSRLSQAQLARAMFPLGPYDKAQVRELAQKFELPNMARKDSQGLCFLGKIKFSDFIKHHLGVRPGAFIEEETGESVGEHQGFWFYTIGQRKGLGLSGGPWYVTRKDTDQNIVYLSRNYFSSDKKRNQFEVGSLNWISLAPPEVLDLKVKIRHGEEFFQCKLEALPEGKFAVTLDGHDQGLASGQFAVFYQGTHCLGSGIIQ